MRELVCAQHTDHKASAAASRAEPKRSSSTRTTTSVDGVLVDLVGRVWVMSPRTSTVIATTARGRGRRDRFIGARTGRDGPRRASRRVGLESGQLLDQAALHRRHRREAGDPVDDPGQRRQHDTGPEQHGHEHVRLGRSSHANGLAGSGACSRSRRSARSSPRAIEVVDAPAELGQALEHQGREQPDLGGEEDDPGHQRPVPLPAVQVDEDVPAGRHHDGEQRGQSDPTGVSAAPHSPASSAETSPVVPSTTTQAPGRAARPRQGAPRRSGRRTPGRGSPGATARSGLGDESTEAGEHRGERRIERAHHEHVAGDGGSSVPMCTGPAPPAAGAPPRRCGPCRRARRCRRRSGGTTRAAAARLGGPAEVDRE